ncbi:MAG: metal-dependent hydrolase [Polyangiaceae bacterium]
MNVVPVPRSPGVDLQTPIDRHWMGGNVLLTHSVNGVCMLFPAGERFFVRAVRHYMKDIDDPLLQARVKGFFGQEGRHAKEHERAFALLEQQGYRIDRFMKFYEWLGYGVIEKIAPRKLSLATTVALEHYTAILAEHALGTELLTQADPRMRALLSWHAAEEIEHRSVAFDVLKQVDPSYAWRMAGLVLGSACLAGFWTLATAALLLQEKDLPRGKLRRDMKRAAARMKKYPPLWHALKSYVSRDFHPSDSDMDHLAERYLRDSGLDTAQAAS